MATNLASQSFFFPKTFLKPIVKKSDTLLKVTATIPEILKLTKN